MPKYFEVRVSRTVIESIDVRVQAESRAEAHDIAPAAAEQAESGWVRCSNGAADEMWLPALHATCEVDSLTRPPEPDQAVLDLRGLAPRHRERLLRHVETQLGVDCLELHNVIGRLTPDTQAGRAVSMELRAAQELRGLCSRLLDAGE
jgi:hypothetical protein